MLVEGFWKAMVSKPLGKCAVEVVEILGLGRKVSAVHVGL